MGDSSHRKQNIMKYSRGLAHCHMNLGFRHDALRVFYNIFRYHHETHMLLGLDHVDVVTAVEMGGHFGLLFADYQLAYECFQCTINHKKVFTSFRRVTQECGNIRAALLLRMCTDAEMDAYTSRLREWEEVCKNTESLERCLGVIHGTVGLLQQVRGRYDAAIDSYLLATSCDITEETVDDLLTFFYLHAFHGLAQCYKEKGDLERCKVAYQELIRTGEIVFVNWRPPYIEAAKEEYQWLFDDDFQFVADRDNKISQAFAAGADRDYHGKYTSTTQDIVRLLGHLKGAKRGGSTKQQGGGNACVDCKRAFTAGELAFFESKGFPAAAKKRCTGCYNATKDLNNGGNSASGSASSVPTRGGGSGSVFSRGRGGGRGRGDGARGGGGARGGEGRGGEGRGGSRGRGAGVRGGGVRGGEGRGGGVRGGGVRGEGRVLDRV